MQSSKEGPPHPESHHRDVFSYSAREALWFSQIEATRFRQPFIGSDHLFLGAIQVEGVATKLASSWNIDAQRVRSTIEQSTGYGNGFSHVEGVTTTFTKIVTGATESARSSGFPVVDILHLLQAMLDDPQTHAVRVLKKLKVDIAKAKQDVQEQLTNLQRDYKIHLIYEGSLVDTPRIPDAKLK